MLVVIRSPCPTLDLAAIPTEAGDLLSLLTADSPACLWIVPTQRRRRFLERSWTSIAGTSAALTPNFATLEGFVNQALGYSFQSRYHIGGGERLLRVARAWQEVVGQPADAALLPQLDRFLRDFQACGLAASERARDRFQRVVAAFRSSLAADRRVDRMTGIGALLAECADSASGPCRLFFPRWKLIFFEGFHRLEPIELDLIAAVSQLAPTALWMVDADVSALWRTRSSAASSSRHPLEAAVRRLKAKAGDSAVVRPAPVAASSLADVGRSLGQREPTLFEQPAEIYVGTAPNIAAEMASVADQIKHDYRAAQAAGQSFRLSDVAVVLPGPWYDAAVREAFPRTGLEFNLAGQALTVGSSRPARVLLGAIQLSRGQWRRDLLADFLHHPLVKLRLDAAHRIDELLAEPPRERRRLSSNVWLDHWRRLLDQYRLRIEGWREGTWEIPETISQSPDEYADEQEAILNETRQLVESIAKLFAPVAHLERAATSPKKESELSDLAEACRGLLEHLQIEDWLEPPEFSAGTENAEIGYPTPWVEYEKDQQAYRQLSAIIDRLKTLPRDRLPIGRAGVVDAMQTLSLLLDSESYQIRTEDDAGVQLLGARELRGLSYRHVYVVGLVEGWVPGVIEEGALAGQRQAIRELREQLAAKEEDAAFLFTQIFESARERLIFSRPLQDGDLPLLPSRFLQQVIDRCSPLPWYPPSSITRSHEWSDRIGAAWKATAGDVDTFSQRMPTIDSSTTQSIARWQARLDQPTSIRLASQALKAALLGPNRPFSPSMLETYAACPFRYFASRVLRLSEPDDDTTRLDYGSLVHKVFELFYAARRRGYDIPDQTPLAPTGPQDREMLVQIFRDEWERLPAGLLPPVLARLFETGNGVADLFIEAAAELESGSFGNLLNEHVLADSRGRTVNIGNDNSGRQVLITGKIDRLDADRENPHRAIIIDYKTGRPPLSKDCDAKIDDGRFLQLPLYAAVLNRTGAAEAVGAAYVYLNERTEEASKAILRVGDVPAGSDSTAKGPQRPLDGEAAITTALAFVDQIRAGDFALTRFDPVSEPRTCECTAFCAYRHACRQPNGLRT